MNIFASDILFYVFGALAVVLSLMVVFMRNPVSSAMMMALSFGATAAVMIGLGAHFLGILQILVYASASLLASSILCPAPKKRTAVRWPAQNRPGTI